MDTLGMLFKMVMASSGVRKARRSSPTSEWVLATERRPGVETTRVSTPGPAIMMVR